MLSSLSHARTLTPVSLFGMVLLLLAICTVASYQYAMHREHARIAGAFDELAAVKAKYVQLRVDGYARTLLDLRGLFVAEPNVTHERFNRFLNGVEVTKRYPALLRIGYAPRVTSANRLHLEGQLRRLGWNDPQLTPGDLPVLYGYPAVDGLLGSRLGHGHLDRPALQMARDLNQPQLSLQRQLPLQAAGRPGFLVYVPLYGDKLAPPTVEQRRQALSGYVFAAFLAKDLIDSTIGADLAQHMGLALFDGPQPDAGRLAYHSGYGLHSPAHRAAARYASTRTLEMMGRPWTFVFVAQPQFVMANRSNLPLAVLTGGVLTSVLAALLAYVGLRRWLAEGRIRHLAYHDELTGLPNRASLRCRILNTIGAEADTGQPCALVIVELTRFRDINYTLGHLIGDEVLNQAGIRLRQGVPEPAQLARISNVQFGVLLPNANSGAAVDLARCVLAALEEPLPARGSKYQLGARAGIASIPGHGYDPDDLIRHADIALNRARTSGVPYVVYDPALDPYKPQRLALLGAFRQAIKEDQLELYCQPKACLRTGRITSVEALVRWQHPEYGLLTPDQFISLIEPTELIQLLTERMLESAMRQSYEWRQDDLALPLAVNLSTRNLLNPALPELIGTLLHSWGADASWVGLEITESSIMDDPALSLRVLNRLHAMGIKLIIDDFGTGYSSLSYLMKLPVAVIKIDQSFTMNMLNDPDVAAIVKAMVELAHTMGMKVVAEGAETSEVWDALKRIDCDEAQGYYISRPLPAHAFRDWLEHSRWQLARA